MNTINMNYTIRAIVAYAEASSVIERATQTRTESRKLVAEFVRDAHGKQWETVQKPIKTAIDGLTVGIVADKVGLLGVIKTCVEYGIMPTTLNADRLRKAKTWTTIDGKIIPNGYKNKHKEKERTPATTPTATTPTATTPTATTPTATATTKTNSKAANKPATPQKQETPIHPLHASVSSSDAPISSTEHFTSLWMQLSKNDTFKLEFIDMIAAGLEVPRATLTTVMWQSAEQIIRGVK